MALRPVPTCRHQMLHHHPLIALLATVIALLVHRLLPIHASSPSPSPPTPPPPPESPCVPPESPRLRPRAATGAWCLQQTRSGTLTAQLHIRAPYHGVFTLHLRAVSSPQSTAQLHLHLNATAHVVALRSLLPDTSYVVELRAHVTAPHCRVTIHTHPARNLVRNPSFEHTDGRQHPATAFHSRIAPRAWTPFYNGGAHRHCGVFFDPRSDLTTPHLHPRSDACVLLLGPSLSSFLPEDQRDMFYGAHQAVQLRPPLARVFISLWYVTTAPVASARLKPPHCSSCHDALSLVLAADTVDARYHDGATLQLPPAPRWTRVCAALHATSASTNISALHIFLHFHHHLRGHVLFDDVSVTVQPPPHPHPDCVNLFLSRSPTAATSKTTPSIHLRARVRSAPAQLSIVVPLTPDRVLRLETLARLYAGGPVVAAVLLSHPADAYAFAHIWRNAPWLRNHVDVAFLLQHPDDPALPINALRNVAVRLATTQFVLMLDVDMTPAPHSFRCFRHLSGHYLHALLPPSEKRIAVLPVFITHTHHTPARHKAELLARIANHTAAPYCARSQIPNRLKRWYVESHPVQTFFATDYEPYGIVRREMHPAYDERFAGYGFNKISWAVAAARWDYTFIVMDNAFVTHLNHVENDWVARIDVAHYLVTWRRFYSFVARDGSDIDRNVRVFDHISSSNLTPDDHDHDHDHVTKL